MNEAEEYLILDTLQKRGALISLFKTGYSYSQILQWCTVMEDQGEIFLGESGMWELTAQGKARLSDLKKTSKKPMMIRPYMQYKREKKLDLDDLYLR